MRRKIEWYQEVLALEPGSRVFFPLAKLFAEHGELEDAERTLRMGLDRHPDALEARLLLIEVLTRLGRQEEAQEMTLQAVKPLERYPAFWTHWAREHAATNRDFSMFLLLVASQFSDKPAKWADVVLDGLHSFADRLNTPAENASRRIRPQSAPRPVAEAQPAAPAPVRPVEGAGMDYALAQPSAQSAAQPSVPPSFSHAAALLAAAPKIEAAPMEEPPYAPAYVAPAYVAPAYVAPDAPPYVSPLGAAKSPVTGVESAPSWGAQPAQAAAPAPAAAGCETGLDAPYEGPAPDAKSFRTRTMAELLATQGDFGGALGIYRELWGRSHDAQEKAELTSRIQRLEEDMASQPAPEAAPKPQVQEDPFGKIAKNRLMSTLEALAARLEARVQA